MEQPRAVGGARHVDDVMHAAKPEPEAHAAGRDVLLRVPGLSKRFGEYQALTELSFEIFEHEILGLIGPRGF
jgi:hypothetical protein